MRSKPKYQQIDISLKDCFTSVIFGIGAYYITLACTTKLSKNLPYFYFTFIVITSLIQWPWGRLSHADTFLVISANSGCRLMKYHMALCSISSGFSLFAEIPVYQYQERYRIKDVSRSK